MLTLIRYQRKSCAEIVVKSKSGLEVSCTYSSEDCGLCPDTFITKHCFEVFFLQEHDFWGHQLTWIDLIEAQISNCNHHEVRGDGIYPFPNFNGGAVEVWDG